jgi:hypothetical protein
MDETDEMDEQARGTDEMGRPVTRDDVTDEAAEGASGVVSNAVVGANVGDGVTGSLGGALVGSITGEDLEEKVADDEEESLPPYNLDALGDFAAGDDTGATTANPAPGGEPE